jgi:hypothetical protein
MDDAFESGYTLDIKTNTRSLSFEMYGWSDQFDRYFNHVLDGMVPKKEKSSPFLDNKKKSKSIDERRFERVKASL